MFQPSPEKLYDMGDDTICEEGSAPEPAIPSSSAAEHEAVAEIPPEPEEPQPDGRPEHRDEGIITEILTEPEGYQEYQNEGTGSAFGSGSQVEAKHEIASNNLGGQADFGPIDEGTVSVFSHNGNEPEHNRSSAELEDEGTVSVFSQKEGSGTDQSRHRGVTMCNIEFRSGSGIIYSQMQVPRGKMIVPPVMEDPSFTGWKPQVPLQARWDQVFVAQYASPANQKQHSRQNRADSRQGGNQGNSNWGGTPQPAGNVQIRTDRYTPPPLTSVLGTPSVSTQNVPYVVRLKTQERFPVAVGYFRIGRNYDAELRIDDNMMEMLRIRNCCPSSGTIKACWTAAL